MSALDRSYLPPEDEARLAAAHERVLAVLRIAPQKNIFLARITMDYSRAVRALRKRGYPIRSIRLKGGICVYTLLERPDPKWAVELRTTFPDGYVHHHTITVNADTISKARNVAQHGDIKTKILSVERTDVPFVLT